MIIVHGKIEQHYLLAFHDFFTVYEQWQMMQRRDEPTST